MFCFHAENWAQTFEITTLFFIVKQWYTPVTCLFWQPLHHLVNYIIIQLNNYIELFLFMIMSSYILSQTFQIFVGSSFWETIYFWFMIISIVTYK